jgi:uncharacterized membrane protein
MRAQLKYALSMAALATVMFVGCNKSPEGGTPGSPSSFTLSLPTGTTDIKQGDKKTVTITVNRGKDFKQAVKLKVDALDKVGASLSKDSVGPADANEVALTLDVGKEAAPGEYKVKVTGTPETGTPTAQDFTIKVEKNP